MVGGSDWAIHDVCEIPHKDRSAMMCAFACVCVEQAVEGTHLPRYYCQSIIRRMPVARLRDVFITP